MPRGKKKPSPEPKPGSTAFGTRSKNRWLDLTSFKEPPKRGRKRKLTPQEDRQRQERLLELGRGTMKARHKKKRKK